MIPKELTNRNQWLPWVRDPKRGKVPVTAAGQWCNAHDSIHWHDYETAGLLSKQRDGVAFVISAVDPFVGVDLDNCLDDEGKLKPWAAEILARFDGVAYAEISPSGKGIKLLTRGKKTVKECRKDFSGAGEHVECYEEARFWTVTGDQFSDYGAIGDGQAALNWLCETHLRKETPKPVAATIAMRAGIEERAAAYLRVYPPAISGQAGHNTTFRAACVLVLGFGLSVDKALPIFAEWNAGCSPPWSDKDLLRKLTEADKQTGPRGYLLEERPEYNPSLSPVDLSRFGEQVAVAPVKKTAASKEPSNEIPEEVFQAEGIIGEFVDYCRATAPRFLPEAALASAISMVSVLTGRKIQSRSGMRANVYMILLAPSRSGKDWPRSRCRECFNAAGLSDMLGATKFASDAGLISQVQASPSVLFQIDEVNRYFATINGAGAKSPHLSGIFSTLMELHGEAGNSAYTPKGYGDAKNNKTISYPHCSLFCTGVPEGFWSAIKSTDVTDGFMGRMMVIETNKMPRLRDPVLIDPPSGLVERIRAWGEYSTGRGNLKSLNPVAEIIQFDEEANERLRDHSNGIEDRIPKEEPYQQAIWAGASANAKKLSMIFAASRGTGMIVTKNDADLGVILANWCTRLLLRRIFSSVSETPAEANRKRVVEIIRKAGTISRSELVRKTQFFRDTRERLNVLNELQESELITSEVVSGDGRAKQVFRLLNFH